MTVLLVDTANVVGSRPDGWWRDRAGAATRLLARLAAVPGRTLTAPDGGVLACAEVVAVVEGRPATCPPRTACGRSAPPAAGTTRSPRAPRGSWRTGSRCWSSPRTAGCAPGCPPGHP
ncbi:hypothetical protein [Blastococcus brunescens]|uniref:NTP pyrophosphohydrolase n=1 Tax=Blastococcus brunescens TaxID=1564165 RepID=A0ABZ1AU24_9ACTN|nr:hypothetical protein [Blastococcus sp. BMG 8361]WRL62085.1 hypothetical protein U6N30_18750 [Blastococcus sp. BMG 8361]